MNEIQIPYVALLLASVFVSSVSQVMLKKASQKEYGSVVKEYLNPLVIFAYVLFFLCTLMTVFAYRGVPLSLGPVLESTSYLYVTVFGVVLFKEKIGRKKALALALILSGILVFALFG